MNVPFVDLKAQYRSLKPSMDAALQNVLERTAFVMGAEMEAFEEAFADYIGVKHALGVSSGTDALHLALRALGVGPGDEVITCPDTYIATCEAISHAGAQVRLVDADSRTYNLDPEELEAAITPRTRAVMPVHLFGQPADMGPILEAAREHHIFVVEDCAQAHGSTYRGKKAGTFGDAAGFSFYPGKNLGAYGDCGAVLTDDDALADRVRVLRNHGQKVKYEHLTVGYCSRMDNLQAAVLGVKLPYLEEWNAARRSHAQRYAKLLAGVEGIVTPYNPPDVEPVYHLYVMRVSDGRRNALQNYLSAAGISTGLHYPIPVHLQKAYADLGYKYGDFPVCELIAEQGLSLPMYAELTDEQMVYVTDKIKEFMGKNS
jgi:dTDP-4-amino-4,6-dideoxygalactose transaminase